MSATEGIDMGSARLRAIKDPRSITTGRSTLGWWRLVAISLGLTLLGISGMGSGVASAQGVTATGSPAAAPGTDEVIDFAAIQATEVAIDPDPSGTSATLTVGTTIDAACAVVFGEDETFGRLATDRDMAGAAHRDHHVVLGGLRPATAYVFRLQGSGIDGRLYRSRPFSFTTPAPSASAPTDLAIGARVVEVSSEFSAAFAGENAVDGDPTTEWSSRGDGDAASIALDLGRPVDVSAVAFRTREMSDGSAVTQTFRVIADGTSFGPFPASELVPLAIMAQVLRFDVETSTGGNTGATEIEVFGKDHAAP